MLPDFECFNNSKEFFVIYIIVKLDEIKCVEIKGYC